MRSTARPPKLELYRLAVQHPRAEVAFLMRCYEHYRHALPTKLKEDFAGSAAVAREWVNLHDDMRALAVEAHGPTYRFARRRAVRDLHVIHADVLQVTSPRVDVVAALNFSTFIYHDRASLLRYFRAAQRSLLPRGVLVADAYGGPGAMRVGTQKRKIHPPREENIKPFVYHWEQRDYDAKTKRTDCRIHFTLSDGRVIRNAFRYDWRLWSPAELVALMRSTGFAKAEIWCDRYNTKIKRSDGIYRPVRRIEPREDWVAYVVGAK